MSVPAAARRAGGTGRARARPRRRRGVRGPGTRRGARQAPSSCRRPCRRSRRGRAGRPRGRGAPRPSPGQRARAPRGLRPPRPVSGEAQAEVRPTLRERREHGVEARSAGEHAVDPRLGVVEPSARDPGQPNGEGPQVGAGTRTPASSTPCPRSTHTDPSPLTSTSVTAGSAATPASGPSPTSCSTSPVTAPSRPSAPRVAVWAAAIRAMTSGVGGAPARIERSTAGPNGSLGSTHRLTRRPQRRRRPPPRRRRTAAPRHGRPRGRRRARRPVGRGRRRARWCRWATPRWATTSSTTSGPGRAPRVTRRRSRRSDRAVGADVGACGRIRRTHPRAGAHPAHPDPSVSRSTRASASASARARRPTTTSTSAPGRARGPAAGSSPERRGRRGRTLGEGVEHVEHRALGHLAARATSRGQHVAPALAGERGHEEVGRDPTADGPQVVPPPAGQVLDAGGHLEPATVEVEVDDDRRRPGGGETPPDRERQRAGAEAPEAPTTATRAGWRACPRGCRPPAAAAPRGARPVDDASPGRDLWTTAPRRRRPGRAGSMHRQTRGGHGTAPVGGTTGAVGEPSSGGEKPVRRSLNPEGERVSPSCPMTGSPRKPPMLPVEIVLRSISGRRNP